MRNIYADLHIHIGQSLGKPVKITASRRLDLQGILFDYAPRKGLDMVGVVDCGSLPVAKEIEHMLERGDLAEHPRGGLTASNGVTLIPACEVESREGVHIILYLPGLEGIKRYQKYMRSRMSNLELSTQRADAGIVDLINLAIILEGTLCPAHAFTPHKGVYGVLTDQLKKVVGKDVTRIKALELGLSADTDMADMLLETRSFTFLTNSDAHSPDNIAREYNLLRMAENSFAEFKMSLENIQGRKVLANYGMDPLLGKYHRSFCPECLIIADDEPPVRVCPYCGNTKIINGVYDRIVAIRDYPEPRHPVGRPVYNYRVPLKDLPGVGSRTIAKLMTVFDNEIEILEKAEIKDIARVAGAQTAGLIQKMRLGRLDILPGGGGCYGKVKKDNSNQ